MSGEEQKKRKRASNLPPELIGQWRDKEKARAAGRKGHLKQVENRKKRMFVVEAVRQMLRAKPKLSAATIEGLKALGFEGMELTNTHLLLSSGFQNAVKTGDMSQITQFVALGGLTFNSSEEAIEEKAQDNGAQQPTEIKIVVDEKDGGTTP